MRYLTSIVYMLTLFVVSAFAQAAPLRVAVFDGGHPFDGPAFDAMLADVTEGMTVTRFHFPADRDKLGPELVNDFDVILFYDMDCTPLSEEQKNRILAMFQSGISVFALHHHVCSNQNWPEYWKCLGGIAVFETNKIINGEEHELSTFIDGQTLDIKVAPDNPVYGDMKDFTIEDEAYGKCYVDPKATVLLTTEHPLSTYAVAWSWSEGKSEVLTLLLGHDAKSYDNPAFRQLLREGLLYLGEKAKQNIQC